jgi:transmembrane protein TMEM260 (protein O-mannosyltransferase)
MKRLDSAISLSLFIGSFTLYIRTLAPSLLYGDSAEFQTIAFTLGVGHPTGYPIYILLAKLFTFLPVGDSAYRVNLFSAFCAALTVVFVYLITRRLGAMHIPAVYGSLAFMLTPLFWKHASIAEIYTLSALCLAVILFAVLQWKDLNHSRWLFLAGLFGGLSLGIHTTLALSGIAIFLFLLLSTRQRVDWIQASLGAFVGIIIFLSAFFFIDFLNVSAGYFNTAIRPSLSVWHMTPADFDSRFERLAFLYFPPQFKGQFFSVFPNEVKTRLRDFAADLSWKLLLAFIGFVSLFISRKDSPSRWRESILLMVALITFITFAITYNVFDFDVYYIPAILVLAMFVGLGVNAVIEVVALIPKLPHFVPVVLSIVILFLGFYPSLGNVASYWKERIPPGLEDWEVYFYEYPDARRLEAERIVKGIEDNAIVFTDWDRAYGFYYVAHVLQGRTEMDFHETYPQEGITQFAESAFQYIAANIESRPIYFSERPSQLASKYKITRAGSDLFRIEKK